MIAMTGQIGFADEQIVVTIQLPEFAVYNIEMFITEVSSYLVDVFFFF